MSKESVFYLILTIISFALMLGGWYLMDVGGIINVIAGIIFLVIGFIIGLLLYGERWGGWF